MLFILLCVILTSALVFISDCIFFFLFSSSLLTFSLNVSTFFPNLVSTFLTSALNSLSGKVFISLFIQRFSFVFLFVSRTAISLPPLGQFSLPLRI